MKDYIPLNFGMLSRWQNWAIVILVVYLAGLALALVTNLNPAGENEDGTDPG